MAGSVDLLVLVEHHATANSAYEEIQIPVTVDVRKHRNAQRWDIDVERGVGYEYCGLRRANVPEERQAV